MQASVRSKPQGAGPRSVGPQPPPGLGNGGSQLTIDEVDKLISLCKRTGDNVLVTTYEKLLAFKKKEAQQPQEPPLQARARRAHAQVEQFERMLDGA
eukprot:4775617-Pyramimonas_sp.AAC.1